MRSRRGCTSAALPLPFLFPRVNSTAELPTRSRLPPFLCRTSTSSPISRSNTTIVNYIVAARSRSPIIARVEAHHCHHTASFGLGAQAGREPCRLTETIRRKTSAVHRRRDEVLPEVSDSNSTILAHRLGFVKFRGRSCVDLCGSPLPLLPRTCMTTGEW